MKVFTAQQMRDFDKAAVEEYGIPSIVLMENAALRVVEFLEAKFAPLKDKKIVILCGKGNNGGDGLAIARHLVNALGDILTIILGTQGSYKGDALINFDVWMKNDCKAEEDHPACSYFWPVEEGRKSKQKDFDYQSLSTEEKREFNHSFDIQQIQDADIIIDALLGTGFKGELRHPYNQLVPLIFGSSFHRADVIYVDLPSSLSADLGEFGLLKDCETSDGISESELYNEKRRLTVTFASPKRGFFVRDGVNVCGEIWIGDIGTPEWLMLETKTGIETLDLETVQSLIPKRHIDAHKGDAGRALIIGGSFGMSGAVALASRAALNVGAGLCIAAMPEKILNTFAASILEATSHPLPCDESGKLLEKAADELPELWKGVQVVALGPGISRSEEAQKFVQRVVRECPVPLVIDADALHALPDIADDVKAREADTVLTPHPGEMGVLMGIATKEVNAARFETVEDCAQKYGATIVLKGARSLVATPKGETFVNLTGNAGMATGGSGDVLTGTIAGLLAQLKNAEDATKLGVYLHGYAGDLAFEEKGNGLVASDIAGHLGRALVEIPQRKVERINGRLRRLM